MNVSKLRLWSSILAVTLCLTVVVTCTTDYVTGKRTFSLVSESQEDEMGREADPQIVAQYGLYDDAELAAYVNAIGQKIAAVSHRSDLGYTVRVVDSPIVNAFALPGGYVYITRGILAHFNSEDELAGVMGHEIGHVAARHSAEQMSRAQLAGLGLQLGSVLSETFSQYAGFAGAGVGLLFLRFSRDQESESDRLGVEYSTRLGYDSHRMAEFFQTLGAMSGESGQRLPSFMSTHPDPGDRENNVNQLTSEWQSKVPYKPLNLSRYDYFKKIDGIVYGPDPRQGYVEGNTFYHPQMKFKFPVPADWELNNSASVVIMAAPEQVAFVQMTLGQSETVDLEADLFVKNSGVSVASRSSKTVNGFPAEVVESRLKPEDGEEIGILSYFIRKDSYTFVFHGISSAADYTKYKPTFANVMDGFSLVTSASVLNKQPVRLHIKQVTASGTVRTRLLALGAPEGRLEELALINGRKLENRVEKGEWLKVVTE
jgi:predicted Zn-dependent protease